MKNELDDKFKLESIPVDIYKKIDNSTCKILINDEEKGSGFFLIFRNEFKYAINLLITTYNIIPSELVTSKQKIKILNEEEKAFYIILDELKRKIKFLKKENITVIEIQDKDEIKNEVNFLTCDLNYIDGILIYKNKDIFIYKHDFFPALGNITEIIELKYFKFNIQAKNDKMHLGSPILLKNNAKVIGIYTKYNENNFFGTFIGELKYSFMDINQLRKVGIKFEINNFNKLSKFTCQIINGSEIKDIGFFIILENKYRFLITSSYAISSNNIICQIAIEILLNNNERFIIELNNKERIIKYFEDINITIIEIIDKDKIYTNAEFLSIINEAKFNKYIDKSIFAVKNSNNREIKFITGKIIKIGRKNYFEFTHSIENYNYSFSYPIILPENLKVIGIYIRNNKHYPSNGLFIGALLKKLKNIFFKQKELKNINIENFDIKKIKEKNLNIFILVYKKNKETNNEKKMQIFGDDFVKKNKEKYFLLIDKKRIESRSQINPNEIKKNIFKIELIEKEVINDMSGMFENCSSLLSLPNISTWNMKNVISIENIFNGCSSLKFSTKDILNWDTSNLKNIKGMFMYCYNLEYLPDISNLDTKNIEDMSNLFYNCSSLKSLPDISKWNTSKVKYINDMFNNCKSLIKLPDISKWNTNKIMNINNLFKGCSSLTYLPDISLWKTENIKYFNSIFEECTSLRSLPNISNWNTSKAISMANIFNNCILLTKLPDISKWNTKELIDINNMFKNCSSLLCLPDISKWNTNNINFIYEIFKGCSSLTYLPDISLWKTDNIHYFNSIFEGCKSLLTLPDISKWNTSNVINMKNTFYNCESLKILPDISKWNTSNVKIMDRMFYNCLSLQSLPDISKWNTSNILSKEKMFSGCSLITFSVEMLKWNKKEVDFLNYLNYNTPTIVFSTLNKKLYIKPKDSDYEPMNFNLGNI